MSEWISVKDRFPDNDNDVLVKHKNQNNLYIANYYDIGGRWYFSVDRIGHVSKSEVTHWMPLPKPPEELK